jgi:hypothetical protein
MLCTKDLDESIYKAWYNSTQLKFYLFLCERQKVKERIPLWTERYLIISIYKAFYFC